MQLFVDLKDCSFLPYMMYLMPSLILEGVSLGTQERNLTHWVVRGAQLDVRLFRVNALKSRVHGLFLIQTLF